MYVKSPRIVHETKLFIYFFAFIFYMKKKLNSTRKKENAKYFDYVTCYKLKQNSSS